MVPQAAAQVKAALDATIELGGQGFKGVFYIEPKPMEPSKHQYDFDVETAAALGLFGSVDANRALFATTPATAGTPTSSP